MRKNKKRLTKPKSSRIKQENGLQSGKKREALNSDSQNTQKENQLETIKPQITCSDLIYDDFIKIYVGKKSADDIGGLEVWQNILDDCADMLINSVSDNSAELWKKISFCDWRLAVAETCIKVLRVIYIEKAANALVLAGFDYVQNLEDDKAYQKQLDVVTNETSSVIVKLNQYKLQYDRLNPISTDEKPKKTELDFDEEIAVLKRHGYSFNKRKQTVTEYCATINAFKKEIERSKKNKPK